MSIWGQSLDALFIAIFSPGVGEFGRKEKSMTKKQKKAFIEKLAKAVAKYAPDYDINCYSIPIAQGILESGWGESKLAKDHNNLFGLKCGTLWKGKSVNMETQEEFEPGTKTTITDNFRVYDSFEEGVKGYFDFLGLARYQNLKGITDPKTYAETIKADGYATDSKYVDSLMGLVSEWNLTQYDPNLIIEDDPLAPESLKEEVVIDPEKEEPEVAKSAEEFLDVMRGWIGYSEANGKYMEIINTYNSMPKLPQGYRLTAQDAWCAATISAAAYKAGMQDIIGAECSCERFVDIFKAKGIWIEDGTITPQPGDLILYSWRTNVQPNDLWSDHIGVVEKVSGGLITTIEGNLNDRVGRRTLNVGNGNIRGYARPKYGKAAVAKEEKRETITTGPRTLCKEEQWVGRVTASALCVRLWAGIVYSQIRSWPLLNKGNLVSICDSVKDSTGQNWWYVKIADKYYGFVSAQYIERV